MRKALSLLLLLCSLIPAARADAPAELPLPYEADTVLSAAELTDAQRSLAHFLYTPIFNGEERILLPQGTRYGAVAPAMNSLMQDYPELFHLGQDYTIGYYQHQPEIALWVEPQYRLSREAAAALRPDLYLQAYLLADAHPDPLALHDALCSRVVYGGETETRHTAAGALLEGRATCEGYAQALTLLYRMAGIPCGVVVGEAVDSAGQSERHAWSIADVGGYTLIDATWNDQDALGLNTHWYYGLSTGQMAADHTPDAGQLLPECGEQANWHLLQDCLISSEEELEAALHALIEEDMVNLRFTDPTLYDSAAFFVQTCLEGAYSIIRSDAQQCIIIQTAE